MLASSRLAYSFPLMSLLTDRLPRELPPDYPTIGPFKITHLPPKGLNLGIPGLPARYLLMIRRTSDQESSPQMENSSRRFNDTNATLS